MSKKNATSRAKSSIADTYNWKYGCRNHEAWGMEAYNSLPPNLGRRQADMPSVRHYPGREGDNIGSPVPSVAGRVNAGVDSEAGDVTHK